MLHDMPPSACRRICKGLFSDPLSCTAHEVTGTYDLVRLELDLRDKARDTIRKILSKEMQVAPGAIVLSILSIQNRRLSMQFFH